MAGSAPEFVSQPQGIPAVPSLNTSAQTSQLPVSIQQVGMVNRKFILVAKYFSRQTSAIVNLVFTYLAAAVRLFQAIGAENFQPHLINPLYQAIKRERCARARMARRTGANRTLRFARSDLKFRRDKASEIPRWPGARLTKMVAAHNENTILPARKRPFLASGYGRSRSNADLRGFAALRCNHTG